jgi:hypothetical protein
MRLFELTIVHKQSFWTVHGIWPSTRYHIRSIRQGLRGSEDLDRRLSTVYLFSVSYTEGGSNVICRVDSNRDGWISINYEEFMKVDLLYITLSMNVSDVCRR